MKSMQRMGSCVSSGPRNDEASFSAEPPLSHSQKREAGRLIIHGLVCTGARSIKVHAGKREDLTRSQASGIVCKRASRGHLSCDAKQAFLTHPFILIVSRDSLMVASMSMISIVSGSFLPPRPLPLPLSLSCAPTR